jgi:TRAP-type C4-dicarboxylate transport system substrate-binding protein
MGIPVMLRIIGLALLVLMSSHAYAVVLKIATLSPEGSSWMEKMRRGAKEIEKRTNKQVRFKFYPGGIMGNDDAVLR